MTDKDYDSGFQDGLAAWISQIDASLRHIDQRLEETSCTVNQIADDIREPLEFYHDSKGFVRVVSGLSRGIKLLLPIALFFGGLWVVLAHFFGRGF